MSSIYYYYALFFTQLLLICPLPDIKEANFHMG